MSQEQRHAEALRLSEDPAFVRVIAEMDADTVLAILDAKTHDERLAQTERLRAIRDIPDALRSASRTRKEQPGITPV